MPAPDLRNGDPCWIDLLTTDPDKSTAFYSELFGWTSESAGEEFGGYTTFSLGGAQVAGGMRNDGSSGAPDMWSIYLQVADAEKTLATAEAEGGQVHVPAMAVGDLGVMGLLADVGGASIGTWQPGEHKGFGVVGEPGAPSWFELHTRAYAASIAFYRSVFGWDTHTASDADDFRYTTLQRGRRPDRPGSWTHRPSSPRACRRAGPSTSAPPMPMGASPRPCSSGPRWCRPPRTPRTAAWRAWPTRPAPSSSSTSPTPVEPG